MMSQCPECRIPAQNKKCRHFKGSNHDLEKTEKGEKELNGMQ